MAAVVTGGASGLGAATVRALREHNVAVAILDRNGEVGEPFAGEVGATFCACDVTDPASVAEALASARAAQGQERLFVGAAGIAVAGQTLYRDKASGRLTAQDPAVFGKVQDINVNGLFYTASQSAAGMAELDPIDEDGTRGAMVTVASVAGEDGPIGMIAYATSKAAVIGMSRSMARDLSAYGIRVNCIQPATFTTPMSGAMPQRVLDAVVAHHAFPRRLGEAEEFASLALECLRNTFLNGQCIRIDAATGVLGRLS